MTEHELIRLLKKGDRDAFNELVDLYQNKIINIAYGMLSDREDALDASQEVFIKVYRSINTFNENSSLSTWIYRIAANICKDYLRKRQRTTKTVSIHADDEDEKAKIQEIPDEAYTPEESAEHTELQIQIRKAIDSLGSDYKAVLVLCDIEGISYEKAAEILKCPVGTVKSRLNRARIALRKKISENKELFF